MHIAWPTRLTSVRAWQRRQVAILDGHLAERRFLPIWAPFELRSEPMGVFQALVGLWKGQGTGQYPNVRFDYTETTAIRHARDWEMLLVEQRTWGTGPAGQGLHLETGIVREESAGRLLYTCAQDSGRAEVMIGEVSTLNGEWRIEWVTVEHAHDERLTKVGRLWTITRTTFAYEGYLATRRTPEYRRHVWAVLARV
jgi:hypothetical protein